MLTDNTIAPVSATQNRAMPSVETEKLKKRLLKVIAFAPNHHIATLLDDLWASGRFVILQAPQSGLVMAGVRDPFDTPFHLGEVLVSQAEVLCDNQPGWGAVCGDEPEKALLLAAVEAADRSGDKTLIVSLCQFIQDLETKKNEQEAMIAGLTAATQVRFEAMKKETVDFGSLGE